MTASTAHVGHVPQIAQQCRRRTSITKRRVAAAPHSRDSLKLNKRFTPNTFAKNARALNVTASSNNQQVNAATLSQPTAQTQKALRLSQSRLGDIAASGKATVPSYPRTLTPDHNVMIHLGVGGFFRSHQALYVHRLLERGGNWAFVGMGLMDFDFKMYDALKSQDYLYTVASKGDHDPEYTVVGSILDFVYAPDDKQAALERMADPQTKLVTLTITEKGYCYTSDGDLDLSNRYVMEDLKDITNPVSAIGFIVAALRLRKERGQKPFTVLSCDNMPENGLVAKKMCMQLAEAADPALAAWIQREVPFPLSMVDRITPVTTASDIDDVAAGAGVEDAWPVVAEDFMQWVVEDNFVDGLRPAYEEVGALVVEDVMPYECMKLRLLNGGHSALSYAAYLLGHREVHAALADPRIRTFLRCYFAEVDTTVPAVRGVNLAEYQETLIRRFSNENIRDQVQRLAQDGSAKLYNTMRDPILELLAADRPLETVALAAALYGRYMTGDDEEGEPIIILDPAAETLTPLARDMFAVGGRPEEHARLPTRGVRHGGVAERGAAMRGGAVGGAGAGARRRRRAGAAVRRPCVLRGR